MQLLSWNPGFSSPGEKRSSELFVSLDAHRLFSLTFSHFNLRVLWFHVFTCYCDQFSSWCFKFKYHGTIEPLYVPYNVIFFYFLHSFSVRLVGNLSDCHTRYLSITEKEESLGCHGNMYNWFHWWNNSHNTGKQILIQDNLWCIEVDCLCVHL